MSEQAYDVVVIGGGVNGTGVARDCALRGLRVALFEKNDLAFGASGNSSGMIHGGPRYLTDHPEITEQSCRDSGYIQHIAPHLLFRIPFLFPIPSDGAKAKMMLAAVDAFFEYYDRYQPLKRGKSHTLLGQHELRALEPGIALDVAGAVTFDEWGIDGARLCTLNVVDAEAHGATIHLHHEVDRLLRGDDGRVLGVSARDLLGASRVIAHAKVVVNATGAWGPMTAELAKSRAPLRPGKGIHVVYDRRVSNYAIVADAIDGREIFLMPWENLSWIGTTDDDYYGDLDRVRATTDEVRYLIEGVARVFPAIRDARVVGTTAGVRPTLPKWGKYESDLSREHEIVDHARDGAQGLYSMLGGKLASYRIFAEEMSDRVAGVLGVSKPCRTHELVLPGGDEVPSAAEVASRYAIPELAARRLVYRHGSRAHLVLGGVPREDLDVVCPCEPVLACEVRHACRVEGARTLADVTRRTRLGLGACGAMRCAHRAAEIVAEERDYPPSEVHVMAAALVRDRFESRVVALDGSQARQEELLAARFVSSGLR